MNHRPIIKDYHVMIPPTLSEVLAEIGNTSEDAEFQTIIDNAVTAFFSFYTPQKITSACAIDLEKFILNYFIMRRVGSGNIKKFKHIFKNRWLTIIPYYERILETQEKESDYFSNPIMTANIGTDTEGEGTVDTTEDTTRAADTTFDTSRQNIHSGSWNENGSSTEINRYSDTPQGDSSDIWETYTDSQGVVHVRLNDVYLTDIRGITNSYSKSGSDSSTDNMTGQDVTDFDETINKITDTDTTNKQSVTKQGYDGVSPAELMLKYRETFLRTYEDIAAELEQCFYNLVEVDDLINFV